MKEVKHMAEYVLFRFFQIFIRILPEKGVEFFSDIIGEIFFLLSKKRRRIGRINLETAFRDSSDEFKKNILKRSYKNFIKVIFESIKYKKPEEFISKKVKQIDLKTAKDALKKKKGVIFITAHLGHFDYGAIIVGKEIRKPINIVTRKLDNPYIEKWVKKWRESKNNRIIYKKNSAIKLLRRLNKEEAVGIVVDQNQTRRDGVFVDFFGKPASTTPAPAFLHIKTGAPIVPVFCVRENGGYKLYSLEPLEVKTNKNSEEAVLEITERINKIIEKEIIKHPEQWFWFHRRWNTTPDGKDNFYEKVK